MEAILGSEDMSGIEVTVLDNDDHKHEIELDYEGNVQSHATDAYPTDPHQRSPRQNERVLQARRYARYHVYNETSQDDVIRDDWMNPDRLAIVQDALRRLDDDTFDEYFGTYARQHAAHFTDEFDHPRALPADLTGDEFVSYRMRLYLTVDPSTSADGMASMLDAFGEVAGGDDPNVFRQLSQATSQRGEGGREFMADVHRTAAASGSPIAEMFAIGAVSGVEVVIDDGDDDPRVIPAQDPVDHEPDAILQLPPVDPGDREEFREMLMFHVLCQVRDSYLGMGIPPAREDFKYQGPGMHEYTLRYRQLDVYDRYHDPDADVDWHPR